MSGRNPGWTLVDIVGNYQTSGVPIVFGAGSTNYSGTLTPQTLSFPNVLPGDLLMYASDKAWLMDSAAGSGVLQVVTNEDNFIKGGTATYRTLYEQPMEMLMLEEQGSRFAYDTSTKAAWSILSAGGFQLTVPSSVGVTGELDFFVLNESYQKMELWRPLLPNTSGDFTPRFPPMAYNERT
jgi:hypothetical protein